MRKIGVKLILKPAAKATLQSLVAVFLAAQIASAQIGAIKDAKSVPSTTPPSTIKQGFEKEGIKVDFSLKSIPGADGKDNGLVAGADAMVAFRITDSRTGQPVTGLRPNAWVNARTADREPNEAECRDTIRTLMGGLLSVRADIDLNGYLLVTVNHDKTVTFINPQVSFNITKLESIVELPGVGVDWAVSRNKDFLYLTMPDASSVAVINTVTRKLSAVVPTGDKTRPTRIAIQPDGKLVWIGLDGSPLVMAIDTATNKYAGTVKVGEGLHNIAFTPDSRFAYVTNSNANTVTVIDTQTLGKIKDIPVGNTPVPIAYGSASGSLYVAAINDGTLSVINPATQQVSGTIALKQGVVALGFEPSGRYAFAVNQVESSVTVIDSATGKVIASGPVVKGADQVSFTRRYAYIRGTESEKISLIDTTEIAKTGRVAPVYIQAGRLAPSTLPQDIGVAGMIQPTPEGNAVMVANAPDMMLYYYIEGMMAPMGTFQNYKRRPRAMAVIDRSLSETEPGVYTVPIKLKSAGRFDVPMLIDQPRIVNCLSIEVANSPEGERVKPVAALVIDPIFKEGSFKPNQPVPLKFKITDSITKQPVKGLTDLQVLIFEPPGVWQKRQWAKEVEDGLYEITQVFPRTGLYNVLVRVGSRGVRFGDLPHTAVQVIDEPSTGDKRRGEK